MSKTDFNYSQALFTDLVNNVRNIKDGKNVAFMLFPRFLSYYLQQKVSQKSFEHGTFFRINSLSSEKFTHLMAKESKVSKTKAKKSKQILDESISAPQTSIVELIAHGDHSTTTTAVKPPPSKSQKTK
ncbi:hypothetical protein Hanom_Chr03g00184301 [Helianthus anomalus]